MSPGMFGKDESYYLWGFKNELQIIPPTLSIPDVHTSNEQHISTNVISMYIKAVTSRCYRGEREFPFPVIPKNGGL